MYGYMLVCVHKYETKAIIWSSKRNGNQLLFLFFFFCLVSEPPGRPLLTLEAADGSDDPIVGFDEANRDEGMGNEEGKEEEQGDAGEEGPESAQVMRAVAGRTLKVECSSDGGNPPPTITWVLITDSCPGGFDEQQKAHVNSDIKKQYIKRRGFK